MNFDLHCMVKIGLASGQCVTAVNGDKSCQFLHCLSSYLPLSSRLSFFSSCGFSLHFFALFSVPQLSHFFCFLFPQLVLACFSASSLWKILFQFHWSTIFCPRREGLLCRWNCLLVYLSIFPDLTKGLTPHTPELKGQQCDPQTAPKFTLTAPILPKRPKKGSNLFCRT